MAAIPSALRDEADSLHSAIPINHIKIPGKKNRGFLEFLEQTNIRQFANQVQQKNPSYSLSRDEIAACWVARVNELWTVFEYQPGLHDAEIHRLKFHEALLQPVNRPFYTRAELYVDRMMNPGLSDRELAKKRAAERKLEKSMQDSLSLLLETDIMDLDNMDTSVKKVDGSAGKPLGQKENRQKQRSQEAESHSFGLEDLICDSDTAEVDSEGVKMLFQETLQTAF